MCMQVKKQQLELDMEQQTGSKLEKEHIKVVYCHPAYLTCIHHAKCQVEWSISWNQDCQEKYHNLRYLRWHHPYSTKQRGTKEPLGESEKTVLKLNIQKTKIMASGPITSWQINGETMETVTDFIFLGFKITEDGYCSHEIRTQFLLGET